MLRNTPQRNRKPPNRYGASDDLGLIPNSAEDDIEDELFQLYGDDSFEDKNYTPETPKRRKVVATVGRLNSKKRVQFADDLDQIQITGVNFDSMYDDLDKSIPIVSDLEISSEQNQQNCSENQG